MNGKQAWFLTIHIDMLRGYLNKPGSMSDGRAGPYPHPFLAPGLTDGPKVNRWVTPG